MPDKTTTTRTATTSTKPKEEPEFEEITVKVRKDIPEALRDQLIRQLGVHANPVVGNFADLQRAGAHVVAGDSNALAAGVETPEGLSDTEAKEGAQRTIDEEAAAKDNPEPV